jgi:arylsulfatase
MTTDATTDRARNVVLVTFDSVRADHCGFVDPASSLTPELDAMAEQGTAFSRAMASSSRTPTSVPELMTGVPMPHRDADSQTGEMARIREHVTSYETVAERFAERGYTTAGFSANPWTGDGTGFPDAFERFDRLDQGGEYTRLYRTLMPFVTGTAAGVVVYYLDSWLRKAGSFSQWEAFGEDLFATIDRLPEPYFVWVFLMDAHNPYIVPKRDRVENSTLDMYYGMLRGNSQLRHSSGESYLADDLPSSVEKRVVQAYRDSVRSVDRFAGELRQRVDTSDTSVVFHADHGEAFKEHGTYGHQNALYQENVHVPLLVYGADAEAGRVVEDPVSLRSMPDLLLSLGDGEGVPVDELTAGPVVSRTASGDTLAVTTRRWKYIVGPDGAELYDLEADPEEKRDVADEHREVCADLDRDLEAYRATVPELDAEAEAAAAREDEELSDEVRSHLQTLGYVD